MKIIPVFHSAAWMTPWVSCHSPALRAILLMIPLQSTQTQQPWARNSPSQIPRSRPAGFSAQLCFSNNSLPQISVQLLQTAPAAPCPSPGTTEGSGPTSGGGGIKRQPTRTQRSETTEELTEITEVFTLLHDYVQFNISHSSAAEK